MAAGKSISLRNILSALIALVIIIILIMYQANVALSRTLLVALPYWNVTYASAWPRPFGGVVASDVTFEAIDGLGGTFHFDHVSLDVPFFAFYRGAFSIKHGALLKEIHDMRLEFTGGHGDVEEPLVDQLALFGTVTGSPFEAEGCMYDGLWIESELDAMGLTASGVNLLLDYHSETDLFVIRQVLDAPGIGRVEFQREFVQYGDLSMLELAQQGFAALAADEWHIKDDGFVAARNRFCAQKDNISSTEFVQRHVRSVKRLLAIFGLAPSAPLEAAYRDFARAGGSLDLVVRYNPPIRGELYTNAIDLGAWLPRMQGEFSVNGNKQPLTFTATAMQPWPDDAYDLSTFQLVQREDVAAARATSSMPSTESAPAILASKPLATSAIPAPATLALASTTASPKPRASVPTAATLATVTTVPDDTVLDGTVPDGTISDYRKLANYIGKQLTIYEHGGASVVVKIMRVAKNGEVRVRRKFRTGHLDYTLDRKTFDHAEM